MSNGCQEVIRYNSYYIICCYVIKYLQYRCFSRGMAIIKISRRSCLKFNLHTRKG